MSLTSLRFIVLMDLLLLFALQNHGCTGGKIFDENGLPLIGAQAVCDDLPAIGPVFSDGTGMYKWPDGAVPEGSHHFTFSMVGFESAAVRTTVKYAVAPGHTAAEGLVYQIPDVRLRRIRPGTQDRAPVSKQPPPRTLPSDRIPEPASKGDPFGATADKSAVAPTTQPAVRAPAFPTLPPPVVVTIPSTAPPVSPPRTVAGSLTLPPTAVPTLPPVLLPVTTVPGPRIPGAGTLPGQTATSTSGGARQTTTTLPAPAIDIAPPGQQWYQSPDKKYSFSAPLHWKVGFQGGKATVQYEERACTRLRILVQVNDSGRPKGTVVRETTTVFSGMKVQQRFYDNGMEGFFFSCADDQYAVYKIRPEDCEATGLESVEKEAMLIITSLQCRQ